VGDAEAAVGAEEDDASMAAEAVIEVGDGFLGGDFGWGARGDTVGGPLAENQLHDGFAPAGEGDGGGEVVCIAAAPDEGGVADTSGSFVEGATGGGGCGDTAADVEGDGADCVVTVLPRWRQWYLRLPGPRSETWATLGFVVREREIGGDLFDAGCGLADLGLGEAFSFALEDELRVLDEGHAVELCELFCAGADEVNVWALFEDEACGMNWVAKALDTGYAASLHTATVHQEGVELNAAVGGKKAAASGIENGVVFEDGDGRLDRIKGRTAAREDGITGFKRAADSGLMGGRVVGRDGPGAAVD
jgi:hypothetical protein